MKDLNFPIIKIKIDGLTEKFDLSDPKERTRYFKAKCGPEIEKIERYLQTSTFIGYLLGKKNSGKGTYTKLLMEIFGKDKIGHLSVGDLVRDVHAAVEGSGKDELIEFLRSNYRGFHTVEETIDLITGRSTTSLISSELIIALLKYEIGKRPRQSFFIDGFPRALGQISYSLFMKELLGFRDDPDFFVFIDLPISVIDERIKYRVICPKCKTPRNTRLLATQEVGYDQASESFYLMCDNPECGKERMVSKEGDELGIEPIRARLEADEVVMKQLLQLKGVPQVLLRNSIPVSEAANYVDDYEITPGYSYDFDESNGRVGIKEDRWMVRDDSGVDSYSLLPAAVVVGFIKQIPKALNL